MPITRRNLVKDRSLAALLRDFEENTELSEQGLSYTRHDFQELYEILPDAFSVTPSISRSEAIRLFRKALIQTRRAGPLTADAVIERASTIHREASAVRRRKFTMWTKFRAQNIWHTAGFRLTWDGVQIRSAANLPPWLQLDEYLLNGVGRIYPRRPEQSGHIILSCDEREDERAVDRMMDALQLVLGLANLYETWGRYYEWGGRNWTEGGLWLGPNQFLFDRRTFRGNDRIWYNPDYDEESWNRHPLRMSRVLEIIPYVRRALAALENHPFRDVLVRATILLQDGFAARDSSHRLLRYWSALEQLYVEADAKGGSNDKVLDRALFAEREPILSRWKLEHIARLRNDYVHAGGGGDDLHPQCQFLRMLLARHINHWIFEGRDLADHKALLSYIKLSGNRSQLEEQRRLIDRRIAFIDSALPPTTD
jgi:hypothetical protein